MWGSNFISERINRLSKIETRNKNNSENEKKQKTGLMCRSSYFPHPIPQYFESLSALKIKHNISKYPI